MLWLWVPEIGLELDGERGKVRDKREGEVRVTDFASVRGDHAVVAAEVAGRQA